MDYSQFLKLLHLNPIIIILVLGSGFWAKNYLKKWSAIRIGKFSVVISTAWKTLIVGTLFTVVYILIASRGISVTKEMWIEFFVSYIFATSFYELILAPISEWVQGKMVKK